MLLALLMLLVVPPTQEKEWPTLGVDLCDWMEENLVHGPGDLRGRPLLLTNEARAIVCRLYEVFPEGHPRAGRRRFKRGHISLAKGLAKTELAACIAIAEIHPDAPVRCDGFTRRGRPVGVGVPDPFIPMLAYTEEQSEDLAYGALLAILQESKVANDFDMGLERVMRAKGDGIVKPFAAAPDAKDGALTTFQHFDEVHRFRRRSRPYAAHKTMLANIPKRRRADAWSLETTTAYLPGEGSVAEAAHEHAKALHDKRASDPTFFYFHRSADPARAIKGEDGTLDAKALEKSVREASGPEWEGKRDIESIVAQWSQPDADHSYLARVWLNLIEQSSEKAFDLKTWRKRAHAGAGIPKGARIALGFDGSRTDDGTGLVACEIDTGLLEPLGLWERPIGSLGEGWEVEERDVDAAVHRAFETYAVVLFYGDPPYWESWLGKWAGEFGEEKVVAWPTYRYFKMAHAVRAFVNALADRSLIHNGDADLTRHVGNAYKRPVTVRDEKGGHMWVIQKQREGSPEKIDYAMAAILANQARLDALVAGEQPAELPWDGHVSVIG